MIPLAVLSFLAFRVTRVIVARLVQRQTFSQATYRPGWRPFSAATLKLKWYLPFLMARAPRWNPHALIVNAGPFPAQHSIRVRIADAYACAGDWTLVLYSHPSYRTLQSASPVPDSERTEWIELPVEPGEFTLSLRYYLLHDAPAAPAIELDGTSYCGTQALQSNVNDFYRTLAAQHNNLFYRAIHYYVYALLRFERWVPPEFLKRELLPVGNPATQFAYGFHRPGQRIRVQIAPELFDRCHTYLTVYEAGSFPVAWYDLTSGSLLTDAQQHAGFYLLRLCARPGETLGGAAAQGLVVQSV